MRALVFCLLTAASIATTVTEVTEESTSYTVEIPLLGVSFIGRHSSVGTEQYAKEIKEFCSPHLQLYPNCVVELLNYCNNYAFENNRKKISEGQYNLEDYEILFKSLDVSSDILKASVGRLSYGIPEVKWWGEPNTGLQIGRFCGIAGDVKIYLGGNHCYKRVTQYPFEVVFNQPKLPDPLPSCLKSSTKGPVVIGNDVWIGDSVTIMSGVKVGDGALLGASTVIRKDVPPYAIVIGNPGEIVAYRHTPKQIKKLLDIKW